MELNYLIEESKALKGCTDGRKQLKKSKTIEDLIKTFYDRIDFCLATNFPCLEYMKKYQEDLLQQGVFVDRKRVVRNPERLVLLGKCDFEVTLTDYAVSRIYAKHKAFLIVKASGNAFVVIDALDDAQVFVTATENARVIVNLYSNATTRGETKLNIKNRETYEL